MNRKMIVFCLVAATTVVFSTGCDVPAEPDDTDGDLLAESADTAGEGPQDTDQQPGSTRAELCYEETEIGIQPLKSKTLLVFERAYEMVRATTFNAGPIVAGETVRMMHAIEDWIEPALMVYPGSECSLAELKAAGYGPHDIIPIEIYGSTKGSLLVHFGESDPIEEMDYQLAGWLQIGFGGAPVLTPTLFNAADYLELAEYSESAEVVIFSSGINLSDYEADGATCQCIIDPALHQETCVEVPMMCVDHHGAAVGAQQLHEAGHRVHVAIFNSYQMYCSKGSEWAAAGGTGQAACAGEISEVEQAVWTVGKKLVSCNLSVDVSEAGSHAANASAGKVNLYINDELVVFDEDCQGDGGWYWVDDETVGLCPNSCADLRNDIASTTFEFSATYGCDSELEVSP